jgi:phage tail sheath protein FI
MGELTFKSPGVSTREIDLSGPTRVSPQGIPAGVIGTSLKGRAFVPITVATYQDFIAEFGASDGEKFGPLAMNEWMRNARSGTYLRVLGVGDGKKRNTDGTVTNAGFVVGAQQVQPGGTVTDNPYATADDTAGTATNPLTTEGRTYFLGCFMSESAGSTIFTDAGIQRTGENIAEPIIRGVLLAPSGVMLSLSSSDGALSNTVSTTSYNSFASGKDGGAMTGSVNISSGKQEFVILLNGFTNTSVYPNVITASFDPQTANYFVNVLNTDPTKSEAAGHYLYTHYDIFSSYAVVTGSGVLLDPVCIEDRAQGEPVALLLSGSQNKNVGTSTAPNFENFEDRFRTAFSPYVISQKLGNSNKNLFKIHAIDDGAYANNLFKITIENIQSSNNTNNPWGKFDLLIRDFNDNDNNPVILESYRGMDLNPSSDRFISRVIGDQHVYYDFDQNLGAQKIVVAGTHPNASSYIRVEVVDDVKNGVIDNTIIPMGFRGHHHLVTSGTAPISGYGLGSAADTTGLAAAEIQRLTQMPVPFRENIAIGTSDKKRVRSSLTWGVQFEKKDNLSEPNKNELVDESISSFTQFFPYDTDLSTQVVMAGDNASAQDTDANGILDSDRFNNNLFTLERVQVATGSTDKPVSDRWGAAVYRRTGKLAGSLSDVDGTTTYEQDITRFLDASKDFNHLPSKKYLKFSFFLQGGFDGVNILNEDKTKLINAAAKREYDDATKQGGVKGPTVSAYRKAIDVLKERSDANIQLLVIPGLRHATVTDYAIEAVEDRFDAVYIMDVEERDALNTVVTGSGATVSVANTVNSFEGRNLDSSFAAAYFPDVVITDPKTKTNIQCPPSIAVLGAFALNDAVAHPWFAPAGFTRGALSTVVESQVKLNRSNLDALYDADINPLTAFAHTPGVVIFGQKTLQAAQSALDRVNVRRLLIDVRRRVRRIGESLLFEPNREDTLARFSASVNPVLQRIQQQQGLDRFKVQIDTTTTTQADVENNTIRGKIFLQPTRAVEFISLDFVVTNQGAEI